MRPRIARIAHLALLRAASRGSAVSRFPEYRGKSDSWLRKEWDRLEEERVGVGYGPKPVSWVPASVSNPEIIERQVAVKTLRGHQIWQRPFSVVKGRIPERKHRQLVEKALRRGDPVPDAVLVEYPGLRRAAQVGTDVAEIYAISPEMLHKVMLDGEWFTHAEGMWTDGSATYEEVWAMMQEVIREHGGAVFQTGGDGIWDVTVSGGPGDLDVPIEGQGYTAPYGTPEFENTERVVAERVAFRHIQAKRVVFFHGVRKLMPRIAGWWQIKPEGTGGIWWGKGEREEVPEEAERYNGDGPADMMGDFLSELDVVYRQSWGRPAYPEEIRAVFDFVFRKHEEQPLEDNEWWPLNGWVDEAAEAIGTTGQAIAWMPEKVRDKLRKAWREYRNSSIQVGVSYSMKEGFPEPSNEALEKFRSDARMYVRHHLTDTLRQFGLDPEADIASSIVELGIYPTFETTVSVQKGHHLLGPPTTASAERVASRYLAADAHKKSVALMKFLSKVARGLGPQVAKNVYVVGGAVRDFVLDRPIKDVDVVIDSVALGGKKDAAWFAKQLDRAIPASVTIKRNQYLVELLTITGSWMLDGYDMKGEVIEIANTRSESYAEGGWKPESVAPADIKTDVTRRELTYNTLLLRLVDLANGPDKKDIIDLTGCGLRDLEEGIMQCPTSPDVVFSDDPSRMIRVIKFALRYGHKLTPDTKAAILRNAPKLKNVPASHLSQMIVDIVLTDKNWKKALAMMADLHLLDPVKDLIQSNKSFRSALQNHVNKSPMGMMFDLMDLGVPLDVRVRFLSPADLTRMREITLGMDRDDAWAYLDLLKNPNAAFKDKSFFPALLEEYGVTKRSMGPFNAVYRPVAQGLLLAFPSLTNNPSKFKQAVSRGLAKAMQMVRLAALHRDQIPGGVGDKAKPEDVDPKQLAKGIEVEMEHTDSKAKAREIALDHLSEPGNEDYYDRLETIEKHAGGTGDRSSVGLFIPLPKGLADQFPSLGDNDSSPAHTTLLYIGHIEKEREEELLTVLLGVLSQEPSPIRAWTDGTDFFVHPEKDRRVYYVPIRFSRDMGAMRDRITSALVDAGFAVENSFPLAFNAHATLEYTSGVDVEYEGEVPDGAWEFGGVELWGLPEKHELMLGTYEPETMQSLLMG